MPEYHENCYDIPDSHNIFNHDGFTTSWSYSDSLQIMLPWRSNRWSDVCNYFTMVCENVQLCIETYCPNLSTRSLNVETICRMVSFLFVIVQFIHSFVCKLTDISFNLKFSIFNLKFNLFYLKFNISNLKFTFF